MSQRFRRTAAWVRTSLAPSAALFAFLAVAPAAHAQLTGTLNVPGSYPTLEAAITDLNTVGVGAGGVTINVVAGNAQTSPAGGYAINLLASNATLANQITIRGNGNIVTAPTTHVVGALTDAIFKIIGEDFVTINGFVMNENAANTTIVAGTNNMTEFGVALFYRTATDGAQNVSILGNTITLNRTYQNTFGIYSNSSHTAAVASTTANASGATGGNNALAIRGNTISNVNIGIVVVGSAGTAADHNEGLDIGGASLATGNTITNYGTTGTFSSYANVSGTVNGILVRNTRNFNISFNTITSSAGGTVAGTLRGIFVPGFSAAPTGTLTSTINNNRISVRTGVVTGTLAGIIVESGSLTATSSITVSNNTFIDSGYTVASASGASTFLSVGGSGTAGPLNTTINSNSFDNLSIASSGSLTLIVSSFSRPANGTVTVNNNSIVTGLTKTLAGGTVRCYDNFGSSPSTVSEVNQGNNFSNISLQGVGATTFECLRSADGATPGSRKTVTNNTISNVSNATTGANTGMNVGFSDNTFAGNEVSGNIISNISSTSTTATTAVIGLSTTAGNQNFTDNTIHTLSAAGLNAVSAISVGVVTTQNVSRNRIYNLSNNNASGLVNGIAVTAGTTINVFNNIIGDLRAPAANGGNPVVGINITGGTTISADYNSVFLNATSAGALFGSSALSASTASTVTLRNNNLVNASTANGAGVSAAYRRSTATLTTYGAASSSNNLFGAALYTDGTNTDTTIAAFRARMSPRDGTSVTENPPFVSTAGANANFLNISTATPTRLESGATPIAGITTDFAGLARNATSPDIGAWEFSGILLDEVPPSITYTPLLNTISLASRVVAVSISDASGVASGGNAPRIYFRKGAGAYSSTTCAGTAPAFTCTIDYTLIGGVIASDVIGYFVIAQDTLGNIGAVPGAGLVASNVNTITTPPTTPASYTLLAPFPGAVNVGPAETITSLTNTGGLFDALNNGVLNSNVAVTLTGDLTAELGTVALNQLAEEGAGAGTYTLTIRPSGAREVRGAAVARLIDFNGADRVTIDGLNAAGNSLLIRNEGVGEIVRYINDASGNNLLNCALEGGAAVTAVNVSTGTVTGNDNIRIAGNIVRDRTVPTAGFPSNGIGSTSVSATVLTSNLTIENNQTINFSQAGIFIGVGTENVTIAGNQIRQTAPRATSLFGIAINGMSGNNVVRNNEIRDLETTLAAGTLTGISVGISVGTNQYTENTIRDLRFSGTTGTTRGLSILDVRTGVFARNRIFGLQSNAAATGALIGIQFFGSSAQPSNATVINNYISLAPTAVGAFPVIGIFDFAFANNTFTADYNSVYVAGTASGAASSWAYRRGDITPTFATLRNNILYNNRSSGTGSHFAIGDQSVNTGTWTSNNNVYFGTGATPASYFDLGVVSAGTPVGFATWQAGPPTRDANAVAALASSVTLSNFFVDAANGNLNLLATATQAINAGTPIAGITTDIAGTTRLNPPEIGAFELLSAVLSINPTSIDFGGQGVGSTSAASTVTLSNTGNASLTVDPLTAAAAPFARAGGTCSAAPITLAAAASCTLTYTFSPTAAGLATQNLTVTSSGEGSGTIALSGTGLEGNLTINPTTLNFGNQLVGTTSGEQTVTLGNSGAASLNVTALTAASGAFARTGTGTCSGVSPIVIGVGASCTLTYTFAPTATGAANQLLTVTANAPGSGSIALNGTGIQGNLIINPAVVAFPNQLVDSTSAEQTVTLGNSGSASLNVIALTAASGVFARTASGTCAAGPTITIAASASCTLTYTFSPSATGLVNQVLTVTANAPGSGSITLSGTGIQGSLTIAPASVNFGNQSVGSTSAAQTVTLSNVGNAPLSVTALTAANLPFARTMAGSCSAVPITIAASGSCTLTYTFAPTVNGAANQSLTVTANAPGSGTIALSGNGVSGEFAVAPNPAAFGNQPIGTTSTALTVTLANNGAGSLDVTALPAPTAPFNRTGGSCAATPFTLTTGTSCTATYTFAPTAAGAVSQNVVITTSPGGNSTLVLSGTGTEGNLTIAPTSVNFGNQVVGTTSTERSVTLGNSGLASLNVTALTAASGAFARTASGTCASGLPITLAAGASCTLTYTFAPSVSGAASQTLTVTANAPGSGSIALLGTGTQGNLTITPTSVNFGNQAVGSTSTVRTVTLGNSGTASLDVTALTAAGGAFARTTGTCSPSLQITIPMGGSCTLSYTFTPTATGAASQTLSVTANAPGSGTIALSGNGTPAAELSISKTSNVNLVGLGLIQYTLVVTNAGPNAVTSAVVADIFPSSVSNVLWSCIGVAGGVCTANGTGDINRLVDLPVGGTVVFSITANANLPLPASISNTATVTAPAGVTDPNTANNTSTVLNVFQIFRNGFEAVAVAPEGTSTLALTRSGETAATLISAAQVQAALSGPVAGDVVSYAIDGNLLVVQARRIGNDTQVRVLIGNGSRQWQVGAWSTLDTARGLRFEWSSGSSSTVTARVTAG